MSSSGDDIGRRVTRSIAWVSLASGIVAAFDASTLAILLWQWVSSEALGTATAAVTLFYFLDLVTEAGLSSVLVQRESLDDETISSVFWLNVIVSFGAFVLLLGLGPLVGWIQGEPIIGWMLIAYGTKLIYQNVYFVPAALLRRELKFKELSLVRTIANAGDSITKIAVAAMGEPVWCFVAGPLARVFITGIGLQLYRPWRPRAVFRRTEARAMLSYGFKTSGSQYLQHFYNNISYQIVFYYFGKEAAGAYRVAYEIVLYPINWVSNVVTQVAFPALARLKGKPTEISAQFLQLSRQNLGVALPFLVLLVAAAPDVLALVFPTLADVSMPVRLLCLVGLLRAIDCLYLPLLDALGFAGRNFAVASFAAAILTTCDIAFAVLLGDEMGFAAVAVGRMVGYPIVIAAHGYVALSLIELGARVYIRHLLGIAACGVAAIIPGIVIAEVIPVSEPLPRLLAIGGTSLAILTISLSRFQGLGLRAIIKALRR